MDHYSQLHGAKTLQQRKPELPTRQLTLDGTQRSSAQRSPCIIVQ